MESYGNSPEITNLPEFLLKAGKYDHLTGLLNMTGFFELAGAAKEIILKKGGRPMLLYIDLSGMKYFNARLGFEEGDKMLQAFSGILVHAFRNECCCRIGADHFAVMTGESELEEKLKGIFDAYGSLYGGTVPRVHVGIYPYRIEDVPVSTACDRAKLACTSLKGTHNSAFSYYNNDLRKNALLKQYIMENFDKAIHENWIQVYRQPIIRAVNEKVCSVEMLARWIDPEKGILPPADFIPVLEETGQICDLDLYMVDRVLESMQQEKTRGFSPLPHSINLSRRDFEACDIVEEIRKRTDAAGVERRRISIEITESIIGRDLDFMKEQIGRFRELGFSVWLDDFGSGYSSLDVLQSIRFDLLKFDMSFMRKFDESETGKRILTELMRMAASLELDTVCEGVETEKQVRFLQDIGCSKLQGYYYSKPMPIETILEMQKNGTLIENENPEEIDYYESISRLSLFDLSVIGSEDADTFQNTFSTVPIGILEVKEDKVRYVRTSRSYRDFMNQLLGITITKGESVFADTSIAYGTTFLSAVKQCCKSDSSIFFSQKAPGGSIVHAIARQIKTNPVTGSVAVAVAVLSVTEPDNSTTYADIAKVLAADYYDIYVIDPDTENYIEYSSRIGGEDLSIEHHGTGFFEAAKRDTMTRIYAEDREAFLKVFTKENVLRELETRGIFTAMYRLIDTGTPLYVNMKIRKMQDGRRLILGVDNIDVQVKRQEERKQLQHEKIALGRIAALAPDFIVLYVIDPATGHYTQYDPSREFAEFGLSKQGEDFFTDVRLDAPDVIDPRDMERHLHVLTKENMMSEIEKNGIFIHNYRILIEGKPVPVYLQAVPIMEEGKEKIILGVNKIDPEIREKELKMTRLLQENAKTGEALERERSNAIIYSHIARALARGCTDLFYVNMDTDELIEYHTDDDPGVLSETRRGTDFFEGCARDAELYVHPDDRAAFVQAMNREYLTEVLDRSGEFELIYRRIKEGRTFYVKMHITRTEEDKNFIVIAVSDIDELMKKREMEERINEERIIYARLHALTGNFLCVYVVDPETDSYREFSATDDYRKNHSRPQTGSDFFNAVREAAWRHNYPEDMERFLSAFTKENIMEEIERSGIFTLGYRFMMDGRPVHVQLKAAMAEEKEGPRLIVGLNNVDAQVRQEEELENRLAQVQKEAGKDALTGVKNRHLYLAAEAQINRQIAEHRQEPFAVVVFDVNNLKKVNDTAGHQAGDQCLRDASKVICDIFKHSPVFRVGGDEFTVIAQGSDYRAIDELIGKVNEHNTEAAKTGGVIVACGMSKFGDDEKVAAVFERADRSMYENKSLLKSNHC